MPYRMSGGIPRQQLTGHDQLLLSICLFIYPDATADEIATFIVANGGSIYERPVITKRCSGLQLSRKRSSKESYLAYSESLMRRLRWFQTLPPPLGCLDYRSISSSTLMKVAFISKVLPQDTGVPSLPIAHDIPPIMHEPTRGSM